MSNKVATTLQRKKEYTLAKPHTHAGRDYLPGEKIHLTARQAAFIAHKLVGAATDNAEG